LHLIRPFAGLRPAPAFAAAVAAPPYDVLSEDEARRRAAGRPWSFLHVSRAEIDLPAGTDPHAAEVYAQAARNLRRMLDEGVLVRDARPCYYAYRMVSGGHAQSGLVVSASVQAYDTQRIRRHEHTRPDKEDDRVRQIEALGAQTGPALLAYPSAPAVDALLEEAARGAPDLDVSAEDGVRHALWKIDEAGAIERFTAQFDAMRALYIADGHHRSAAASRVAATRRAGPAQAGDAGGRAPPAHEYFLAVAFAHHRMRILPYHRLVRDLRGMSAQALLAGLGSAFEVERSDAPVQPSQHGDFGLYLPGQWHRLRIRAALARPHDPVERLDVSLLAAHVLEPLLGIADPRTDRRIDFVGGVRGLAELARRVDSGEMAAAFSLYPTRIEDLMAVADAGRVMPPKSTWFEPKLADGLVSHLLD
jgi:uncharacterized protein (DUF1015 family)